MALSQLDIYFRQILRFSNLFTKSWGPPDVLKMLRFYQEQYAFQGKVIELIEQDMPKMIIEKEKIHKEYHFQEGSFHSPLDKLSPFFFKSGRNNTKAIWQGYFPPPERPRNGLVIHLAPTGDHTFFRRYYLLVKGLLEMGISSIMLQNPFYAKRKPHGQYRSALQNVSDLYVMGGALICESCFLLRWAKEQGYSPLGLSGVSMGGYMASLAATNFRDEPIALIPLLSWTSAAPVYTQGALADSIIWPVLAKELRESKELQLLLNETGWADMIEDKSHIAYQLFPETQSKRLMWILMEEFTNLRNYPAPVDNGKVHFVVAEHDAYVPRLEHEHIPDIRKLWPGSKVTEIRDRGHVGAYFTGGQQFRDKIIEALGLELTVLQEKTKKSHASTTTWNLQLQQPLDFMLERIGIKNNASIVSSPIFEETKQSETRKQKSNI